MEADSKQLEDLEARVAPIMGRGSPGNGREESQAEEKPAAKGQILDPKSAFSLRNRNEGFNIFQPCQADDEQKSKSVCWIRMH